MFWKWFWRVTAILLILAVFVGGGIAIYRAGYAHGATTNLWTTEEGGDVLSQHSFPHDNLYFRPYARPRMFFPGFSLFMGFILVVFLFGGIGRMIRYSLWQGKGKPCPPHWGPGWHKYHHEHFEGEGPYPSKSSTGDEADSNE